MRYEKSCGAVVYTRHQNKIWYVVICQINGDWGFPKGHMEPGEDEKTTALREIREEVGITAEICDGFREESGDPCPHTPNVMKQSVYFLAEYSDQMLISQPEEVKKVYLMPYEQALETLTFAETRNILTKANQLLKP